MMSPRWFAAMLLAASVHAQAGEHEKELGMAALGRLVGHWSVEMEIRDQEGNWLPQSGEREWRWYFILDRKAIQDNFITVHHDDVGNVIGREIGTNIRIYNKEEQQWHMAWIHSERQRLATFTARNDEESVVMHGVNDRGREVRNTFFEMEQDRFEWVQEWTFDEGASWVPVARIHARRVE